MSAQSVRMRPDDEPPGVGPPDVEPGRFANIMSAQGDHAFKRFTTLDPAADSTAESPCGAPPQTLYTTLFLVQYLFPSPPPGQMIYHTVRVQRFTAVILSR